MRFAELPHDQALAAARRGGLAWRLGPFQIRLGTRHAPLVTLLRDFYPDADLLEGEHLTDFQVRMDRPWHHRRWLRPQIDFFIEGDKPFEPYPRDQALPLFEWGLNWCIAKRAHQFLMLHAAVVERQGRALILPAAPGAGKSTLCTALIHRGWRLLSDEFGLVRPETGRVWPLPKAIPLKNVSIDVIRDLIPEARLGPLFPGTRKGDVAHARPPGEALRRQHEPARPAWVVFPQYRAGAPARLQELPQSLAFIRLAHNSFNYHLKGETGFRTLTAMVRHCRCFSLEYGDLLTAVGLCDALGADPAGTA